MATWTRYLVANPELAGATNTDLTGIADVEDGTEPGNFAGSTVNSVRFVISLTGSGFGDDTWDVGTARLHLGPSGGTAVAFVDPATDAGNGNETATVDLTDSTPTSTAASYSTTLVLGTDIGSGVASRTWAVYQQNAMPDGGTIDLDGGTSSYIVIDYTPPVTDPAPSSIAPPAATVPNPTVGAGSTLAASPIAPPAATVPTPTVAGHVSITATAIAGTATVTALTPSTGSTLSPASIIGTGFMDTPVVGIGVVVVAAAVAGTSVVGDPSIFELVRVNANGDVTVTGWTAVNAGTVWQAVESDDTAYATYNY